MLQTITDFIQVLNEQHKLVVQPACPLCNFPRVLTLPFLLPQAVNYPQGSEQGGGADNHNIAVKGLLEQIRLGLQCGGKSCLDRYKQQHEVQAVQAFESLIVFTGQAFYMIA